jgi:hypothetical protein
MLRIHVIHVNDDTTVIAVPEAEPPPYVLAAGDGDVEAADQEDRSAYIYTHIGLRVYICICTITYPDTEQTTHETRNACASIQYLYMHDTLYRAHHAYSDTGSQFYMSINIYQVVSCVTVPSTSLHSIRKLRSGLQRV